MFFIPISHVRYIDGYEHNSRLAIMRTVNQYKLCNEVSHSSSCSVIYLTGRLLDTMKIPD